MRVLLATLIALSLAGPARAELVDGVVAAIDYKIVARSTLSAYRAAFVPAEPPALALQALIDDQLLGQEARRYGLELSPERLAEGLARWPRPTGMGEAEWRALVADHMLARQFLDFRFADFVPIPREELRAYYEAHRAEFGRPFAEVEDRIRALLTPAARARREGAYREELRTRYEIRVNAGLLPPE